MYSVMEMSFWSRNDFTPLATRGRSALHDGTTGPPEACAGEMTEKPGLGVISLPKSAATARVAAGEPPKSMKLEAVAMVVGIEVAWAGATDGLLVSAVVLPAGADGALAMVVD